MFTDKIKKYTYWILIALIFIVSINERAKLFDTVGKDFFSYKRAVLDFVEGNNPYEWTVQTYNNPDDPTDHGFAYLPVLIYVNLFGYLVEQLSGETIPMHYTWKFPVLFADIGVGILLLKYFSQFKEKKYIKLYTIFALLVWFFNPYFYIKTNYVYTDPLPIFFMFLSMYLLKNKPIGSGITYAIAVGLKTFPILLLPVMLLESKNWKKFFGAAALTGILICLPFMSSYDEFITFINGALLVHGDRYLQGRPFLFYISYFYKIEFFQIVPLKVYTTLASFSGWILVAILYFFTKYPKNHFVLGMVPFALFYLFTPVLNKTYMMWWLPVFLAGAYHLFDIVSNSKYKVYFSMLLVSAFWLFNYWYLSIWVDGFHIWRPL